MCLKKKWRKNKVRVKKKLAGLGFIKLTGKIIYVGLNFYNFLFIAYNSWWVSALQKILNSIRWLRSWRKDLEKSVILFILYSSFDKKILQVLSSSFNNNMVAEIGQVIQQCNNAEVGQVMHSLTNFVNVPVLLFWLCASNVCSFASCIYCI